MFGFKNPAYRGALTRMFRAPMAAQRCDTTVHFSGLLGRGVLECRKYILYWNAANIYCTVQISTVWIYYILPTSSVG